MSYDRYLELKVGQWYLTEDGRAVIMTSHTCFDNVGRFTEKEWHREYQSEALSIKDLIKYIPDPKFSDNAKVRFIDGTKVKIVDRTFVEGEGWLYSIRLKKQIMTVAQNKLHPRDYWYPSLTQSEITGKDFEKTNKKQTKCFKCKKWFIFKKPEKIIHTNIITGYSVTLCACPYCSNLWEETGNTMGNKSIKKR